MVALQVVPMVLVPRDAAVPVHQSLYDLVGPGQGVVLVLAAALMVPRVLLARSWASPQTPAIEMGS